MLVGDLAISITLHTRTINRITDCEFPISCVEVLSSGEVLTGQSNHYICRWDHGGEFKGAILTSFCEAQAIKALKLEAGKCIVCAGSNRAIDVFFDFCPALVLLAK